MALRGVGVLERNAVRISSNLIKERDDYVLCATLHRDLSHARARTQSQTTKHYSNVLNHNKYIRRNKKLIESAQRCASARWDPATSDERSVHATRDTVGGTTTGKYTNRRILSSFRLSPITLPAPF